MGSVQLTTDDVSNGLAVTYTFPGQPIVGGVVSIILKKKLQAINPACPFSFMLKKWRGKTTFTFLIQSPYVWHTRESFWEVKWLVSVVFGLFTTQTYYVTYQGEGVEDFFSFSSKSASLCRTLKIQFKLLFGFSSINYRYTSDLKCHTFLGFIVFAVKGTLHRCVTYYTWDPSIDHFHKFEKHLSHQ